jgi:hypothetical protein
MEVNIKVLYYQQGSTPVEVRFTNGIGNTVQFVSGETVNVNGTNLRYDSKPIERLLQGGAYVGEVARQGENGTYTMTYTPAAGNGDPVSIPIKVINSPVRMISPKQGDTVPLPKDSPLLLTYERSNLPNTGMVAVLNDSRGNFKVTLSFSETGSLSVSPDDVRSLQPGPGEISVARITTNQIGGTPFREAKVEFQNIARIQVTWQ